MLEAADRPSHPAIRSFRLSDDECKEPSRRLELDPGLTGAVGSDSPACRRCEGRCGEVLLDEDAANSSGAGWNSTRGMFAVSPRSCGDRRFARGRLSWDKVDACRCDDEGVDVVGTWSRPVARVDVRRAEVGTGTSCEDGAVGTPSAAGGRDPLPVPGSFLFRDSVALSVFTELRRPQGRLLPVVVVVVVVVAGVVVAGAAEVEASACESPADEDGSPSVRGCSPCIVARRGDDVPTAGAGVPDAPRSSGRRRTVLIHLGVFSLIPGDMEDGIPAGRLPCRPATEGMWQEPKTAGGKVKNGPSGARFRRFWRVESIGSALAGTHAGLPF